MLKRHPVLLFFVLAYAFSWLVWGTSIAQARGLLSFHIPGTFAFIGLSLAAVIAVAVTGGRAAIIDLFRRMARWRVGVVWYGVALLLTPVLSALAIGLHLALGGTHETGVLLPLAQVLPSFAFYVVYFLLTEETAWRGFALPRLQQGHSALSASLILGLLWGLWHTPLFFMADTFQASVPFVGFILSAVATTILMTWVFNHTRESVLIAALLHAATDTTIAFSNVMTGDLRLFWLFVGLTWVAAVVVVLIEGPAHLNRSRQV